MSLFDDFMTDTVTIEPLLSKDDYGIESYGGGTLYACRIDVGTKQTVNINGVERSVDAMVYLLGTLPIGPTDRLTLPAGFSPQQPPILRVSPFTDELGSHHTEIALGSGVARFT